MGVGAEAEAEAEAETGGGAEAEEEAEAVEKPDGSWSAHIGRRSSLWSLEDLIRRGGTPLPAGGDHEEWML